jgi:hypothetical protein
MYKRSVRLVLSTTVISLAFLGLAIVGCAGSPKTGTAGESTYYVRADGSDRNNGLSEEAPFKTLRKAVDAANKGRIKTIIVLGVLNLESEGESSLHPYSVFTVTNTRGAEITIRGKEGADAVEQGVLSGAGAGRVVISVMEESRIRLEHLEIEGGSGGYAGGGINVRDQSRLTLGNGTLVWNNHSQSSGGGVAVVESGTLIIQGGMIFDNTAQSGCGGVVVASGTFIMEDGGIYDNETAMSGGGVGIQEGNFIMRGGEISGNESVMGGGGVVVTGGTFTIMAGLISDNTTQENGGGVAISGGTFIMEGGEISGKNTAQGGGGGVLLRSGSFTMRGGEISSNESPISGGGVVVESGNFTMESGEISGNKSIMAAGGGVMILGGTFTMQGGLISGNESPQSGGGVLLEGGIFTMEGGNISGNTAQRAGGGLAIDVSTGGEFIKTGGTIDAANSARAGSVVYVYDEIGYRKRDSVAGPDVTMDTGKSGSEGGWE